MPKLAIAVAAIVAARGVGTGDARGVRIGAAHMVAGEGAAAGAVAHAVHGEAMRIHTTRIAVVNRLAATIAAVKAAFIAVAATPAMALSSMATRKLTHAKRIGTTKWATAKGVKQPIEANGVTKPAV